MVEPADEHEIQQWKQASPKDSLWSDNEHVNDERVLAFQYAVEFRVLYLYNRYYQGAGFEVVTEFLKNVANEIRS